MISESRSPRSPVLDCLRADECTTRNICFRNTESNDFALLKFNDLIAESWWGILERLQLVPNPLQGSVFTPTVLGPKEAEMQIIGCDLHARQQTLALLDAGTGEVVNRTLTHEGNSVREFYSTLPGPVRVGIEATGSMKWFLHLMEELGIDCQVGHPATIRAAEPRRQKHDQRDAELLLKLLVENRFPSIWQPSQELLDPRGLLLHRHQWVRLRTRIQNALQAIHLLSAFAPQ